MAQHNIVVFIAESKITTDPRLRFPKERKLNRLIVRTPEFIRTRAHALSSIESTVRNCFATGELSKVVWFQALYQVDHLVAATGCDQRLLKQASDVLDALEEDNIPVVKPVIDFDPTEWTELRLETWLKSALTLVPELEAMEMDNNEYSIHEAMAITGHRTPRTFQKLIKQKRLTATSRNPHTRIKGSELYRRFMLRRN